MIDKDNVVDTTVTDDIITSARETLILTCALLKLEQKKFSKDYQEVIIPSREVIAQTVDEWINEWLDELDQPRTSTTELSDIAMSFLHSRIKAKMNDLMADIHLYEIRAD